MSVITISRQMGSLGTEIAQAVASKLNYASIDKEKIGQTLAEYGLPLAALEQFDEKKPPFWDSWQVQRRKFLLFLQSVIYDFAAKGNTVIVGRGGQVLLKNLPGILHVRIIAPFDIRVKRMMEREKGEESLAREILRRSDSDSAGFLHSFFDADWNDQNLYDLVINTQKLSESTAANWIVELALSPEMKEKEKALKEKLTDVVLNRKVEAALLDIMGTDIQKISIRTEGGVVTLSGWVPSAVHRKNCEETASRVSGINQVDNKLLVVEYFRHSF
jgi:cytidylate kinase